MRLFLDKETYDRYSRGEKNIVHSKTGVIGELLEGWQKEYPDVDIICDVELTDDKDNPFDLSHAKSGDVFLVENDLGKQGPDHVVTFIKGDKHLGGTREDMVINSPLPGEAVEIVSAQEYLYRVTNGGKNMDKVKWADFYAVYTHNLR